MPKLQSAQLTYSLSLSITFGISITARNHNFTSVIVITLAILLQQPPSLLLQHSSTTTISFVVATTTTSSPPQYSFHNHFHFYDLRPPQYSFHHLHFCCNNPSTNTITVIIATTITNITFIIVTITSHHNLHFCNRHPSPPQYSFNNHYQFHDHNHNFTSVIVIIPAIILRQPPSLSSSQPQPLLL